VSFARFVREQRWRIAAVAVALAVVVIGKQYYRDASAHDLRWILAPTAELVSWVTGHDFVYEAGQGWKNTDVMFVIAPACAGVNFALAAFLALVLGGLTGITGARATLQRLAVATALAFIATLVVNTTRIAIAVDMHRADLHRLEGIVVYVVGLCALYTFARALDRQQRHISFAIPIAAYLVITLGLPLLNGAGARADFAQHAAVVVAVCAVVVLASLAARLVAHRMRHHLRRES
jgi:exosortase K